MVNALGGSEQASIKGILDDLRCVSGTVAETHVLDAKGGLVLENFSFVHSFPS